MRFGIEFRHAAGERTELLDMAQYKFTVEGEARKAVDYLNSVNNPAWNGEFAVVTLAEKDRA